MPAKNYYVREWGAIYLAPDASGALKKLSGEDNHRINNKLKSGRFKTERLSGQDGLIAIKISKGERAICKVIDNSLVVLALDLGHEFKIERINKDVTIEKSTPIMLNHSITGVIGDEPLILSEQQAVIVKDFANPSHRESSLKCYKLGGMPGSGKTTLGLLMLNREIQEAQKFGQDIEAYYVAMDPNLVKAGRSKFEEEVSDSDNSGSDSDSTDDTDPVAAAAGDGGAAQIPDPRLKFLSYKEVIQQKIDDLKEAGLLSQDFGYLDNDRALNFFSTWFTSFLKNKSQKILNIHPTKVLHKDIYSDLQKLDVAGESQMSSRIDKGQLQNLKKAYIGYLLGKEQIDPAFFADQMKAKGLESTQPPLKLVARGADVARAADDLTEETPTQQVRKFVALDESQGLSPSEIHSFLYALGLSTESLIPGIEHTLLVLGDGDQSLEDPYDFVAQSIRHYTGKQSLESQDLNLSFRVSPIVREFAQLILDAKAKVVGGNVNKDIKHTIDTAKDDEEGGGILKFINERDGRTIEALRGNIRVNTLDTIIIIFAEEDREEARSIFADGNSSPIVIHARNTLGLEWNNVVLFKPFGDNSPLYRHKKLIETNYDASAPVPTSRPKNDHGIEAVIPFNEFYVAATRPLNGLYVFDHANNTLANLFETASTHIWSKSKDLEVESAKEQTLEELMAYIKNNSKVLDYEQILKQLISQAVERIEATTHDAKITKKYLTTLKQLIQETDSDLLNRVGTILKPILEAEIRAKAEAEKIAAEAKILAKAEANGGATVSPKTTKAKTSPEPKKAPAAEAKTSPEPKKASAEAKGGATTTPKTTKAKKAPAEAQVATATNTSLEQELFKAIKNNNIKEAERLLEKGANPNLCNQDGFFPLHMAVRQGNMEIVKLLLSQSGIMINPKDNKKNTPLAIAKEMQYAEIEKLLVSHQKLFLDIVLKDEKQVKELLKSGVNPNQVNNDGKTPLMIAVEKGYTNILKLLLEKGANAGLANDAGINTLHCAAQSGHLDIVELLLENGADINKASKNGATPLHFASIKGYYDITALLLNKVVNPSYRDNEGRTALHFAVDKGDTDIVKLLLDKSVDPNLADKKGNTALSLAVVSNNTKLVELLLEQKSIEVNYTNPEGSTAFHLACSKSDVSLVRLFLEKGADVTLANKSGSQPLHAACQNSNAAVVELLLATKKVDVNTFTKDGLTPLHIACGFRNAAVVNLLLQNNADIFSQDRNKQTALMLAKQINNQKIVTILENKIAALVAFFKAATEGDIKSLTKAINDGIHLDAQDANGVTPLLLACQSGHTAVVQALIENRANISIVNKNGGYALHFAAQNGHLDIVKLLLGKGANISIANKQGGNALHLAAQNGHLDIVKLLLGKGANINQPDQGGFTPLLLACQNGHTSVVQALLENRANISIANKQGGNALHLAAQMVHLDIVKLLLKNGADLNNINKINGATALHIAAADNNLDFVKFFLAQKGINIDIMDLEGRTPLDVTETDAIIELLKDHLDLFRAMRDNNTESIQKLLDKGVNPNQVDSDGLTPLHHAIQKGNMDVLKLLLKQKDIDVNAVNRSGLTILHEAIKKNDNELVETLLAQGAKITNMDDMNPLHVAMSQKNQDIMLSLLKHGADINEADNIGNTTLIKAILYYKDFVGFLLGERANPNIVNKNGENALHYAIKKGNMHVLKLLLEKGAVVDDSIIEVARESRNQEIIDLLCTPVDTLGVYTTIGDTLDDGADS